MHTRSLSLSLSLPLSLPPQGITEEMLRFEFEAFRDDSSSSLSFLLSSLFFLWFGLAAKVADLLPV